MSTIPTQHNDCHRREFGSAQPGLVRPLPHAETGPVAPLNASFPRVLRLVLRPCHRLFGKSNIRLLLLRGESSVSFQTESGRRSSLRSQTPREIRLLASRVPTVVDFQLGVHPIFCGNGHLRAFGRRSGFAAATARGRPGALSRVRGGVRRVVLGDGGAPPGFGEGCRSGHQRGVFATRPAPVRSGHSASPLANPQDNASEIANTSRPSATGKAAARGRCSLPRRREEIPRPLPPAVPVRPHRPERKHLNLPRSRRQLGMHTFREMSHRQFNKTTRTCLFWPTESTIDSKSVSKENLFDGSVILV